MAKWVSITLKIRYDTKKKFINIKKDNNLTYDQILNEVIRSVNNGKNRYF